MEAAAAAAAAAELAAVVDMVAGDPDPGDEDDEEDAPVAKEREEAVLGGKEAEREEVEPSSSPSNDRTERKKMGAFECRLQKNFLFFPFWSRDSSRVDVEDPERNVPGVEILKDELETKGTRGQACDEKAAAAAGDDDDDDANMNRLSFPRSARERASRAAAARREAVMTMETCF